MDVLSAVILVVFAVIGVITVVRDLTLFLFRNKNNNSVMFVTPVSGECEDAELVLRSAAARVRWISRGKHDYVICLDCDMDDETRQICEKICKEYGFSRLLSKAEFLEMIN